MSIGDRLYRYEIGSWKPRAVGLAVTWVACFLFFVLNDSRWHQTADLVWYESVAISVVVSLCVPLLLTREREPHLKIVIEDLPALRLIDREGHWPNEPIDNPPQQINPLDDFGSLVVGGVM